MDTLVDGQRFIVVETAKVDKPCVYTVIVQYVYRIPSRMSFTEGSQYFSCCQMDIGHVYVSRSKNFSQAVEQCFCLIYTEADKVTRLFQVQADIGKSVVYQQQPLAKRIQCTAVILPVQKLVVNSGLPCFLML
ncbi:hypothetical protein SDC9_86533 [bioreactor metagenome]|uniref:Uncharacterized protein n=1 Tax=bioreactor metagenome TaxID=1076179 RepID=A0A644ZGQ3_9ZZZZ